MGFAKGTVLGKRARDEQGRPLRKDGTLCDYRSNTTVFKKGQRYSPRTEFKKGLVPHNKGKKLEEYASEFAIKRMQKTQFKKGQLSINAAPEGTVTKRERVRNGKREVEYIINIDWRGNRKSNNQYKWYLWEVENQQDRPSGMVLAVKNGDPDDIRLENLELLSRAENLERNCAR